MKDLQEAGARFAPEAAMSLRRIDDEKFGRTYYVKPRYAEDDGTDRNTLVDLQMLYVEEIAPDGGTLRLEGSEADQFAPRVWELIRGDDSLLDALERPLSAFDEVGESVSHLQRMRELRRRLQIRRSLDQDVG
jgi:hypothetical protein